MGRTTKGNEIITVQQAHTLPYTARDTSPVHFFPCVKGVCNAFITAAGVFLQTVELYVYAGDKQKMALK